MSDYRIVKLRNRIKELTDLQESLSYYSSSRIKERIKGSRISDSTANIACWMSDIAIEIKSLQDELSELIKDKKKEIDKLPRDLQEIAKLRHIDSLSIIKIANHYDKSVRWVKYKLKDIKKAGV